MSEAYEEGVVRDAERILELLKNEIVKVKEDSMEKRVARFKLDEDGKERKKDSQEYVDWLANARNKFEIFRNNRRPDFIPERFMAAADLVKAYGFGQTRRYLETGEGYIFRMTELESLSKKLSQDLVTMTKDRDDWKKRAGDCEKVKFGTKEFFGDVTESS